MHKFLSSKNDYSKKKGYKIKYRCGGQWSGVSKQLNLPSLKVVPIVGERIIGNQNKLEKSCWKTDINVATKMKTFPY